MAEPFDSLARQALELPVTERSRLADKLIESLDELSSEELDHLWALEGERRYQAYKAGRIEAIPGDEVHRQIVSSRVEAAPRAGMNPGAPQRRP